MATAIHHGPPGSFKSFTLIQRFAIRALQEGRIVVTNVRGFDNINLVIKQFPELEFPETADIIYVDCQTRENRQLMARWFHWVPFRSVIIIDEVQQIYPNRKDFKMESLDYLDKSLLRGYEPDELPEPRPDDIFVAFEKQRHYNWDIYLSTPNIAKVKSEIRQVAEWAYRHRNISGVLPWKKNCWYEHQHDPENNGKLVSHRVGAPNEYKADERVFKCYSSTATGEHTENQTGRSIFQDPKILLMLGVVGLSALSFIGLIVYKSADSNTTETDQTIYKNDSVETPSAVADVRSTIERSQGAHSAIQLLKPTLYDYRNWSYAGIKPDELNRLPDNCRVFNHHATCFVSVNIAQAIDKNYFCVKRTCKIILSVIEPEAEEPEKVQKLALL